MALCALGLVAAQAPADAWAEPAPGVAEPAVVAAPKPVAPTDGAPADEPSALPWVLVGAGGLALSAGIALGAWSVVEHRTTRELGGWRGNNRLDEQEQAEFDAALALRDDLRVGSGVAAATALGLFVAAGVLFALDESPGPKRAPDEAGAPTAALLPTLGPGFAGGAAIVRF